MKQLWMYQEKKWSMWSILFSMLSYQACWMMFLSLIKTIKLLDTSFVLYILIPLSYWICTRCDLLDASPWENISAEIAKETLAYRHGTSALFSLLYVLSSDVWNGGYDFLSVFRFIRVYNPYIRDSRDIDGYFILFLSYD